MTRTWIPYWLAAAGGLLAPTASAQEVNVAVGYTRVPGRIGEFRSDQGVGGRASFQFGLNPYLRLGLEAGVDRLNRYRTQSNTTCVLASGAIAPCSFDTRSRDVGYSVSALLRIQGQPAPVRTYAAVGLGGMSVRTHLRQDATDGAGNPLANFSIDGTSTDGAFLGYVGAGVAYRPPGFPVMLSLEARVTYLMFNYSGGIQTDFGRSLMAGVRLGR